MFLLRKSLFVRSTLSLGRRRLCMDTTGAQTENTASTTPPKPKTFPFPYCRSFFYVPSKPKTLEKVPHLLGQVDLVVCDLEDGIGHDSKVDAREHLHACLTKLVREETTNLKKRLCVRINSFHDLIDHDLECLAKIHADTDGFFPSTIALPKVESAEQVLHLEEKLLNLRLIGSQSNNPTVNLVLFCESPLGLIRLHDILVSILSKTRVLQPQAIVFGSDDYCAMAGCVRSDDGAELAYARQKIVCHARAFHLQPIDMVYLGLDTPKVTKPAVTQPDTPPIPGAMSLKESCKAGAELGFVGKQIIHPNQITAVHDAFTPSVTQLDWAREVMSHFETDPTRGVFIVNGQMIDEPLLKQAKALVAVMQTIANVM